MDKPIPEVIAELRELQGKSTTPLFTTQAVIRYNMAAGNSALRLADEIERLEAEEIRLREIIALFPHLPNCKAMQSQVRPPVGKMLPKIRCSCPHSMVEPTVQKEPNNVA